MIRREAQPAQRMVRPKEEAIVLDPNKKIGPGPIIGVVALALALAVFIVVGIRSRASAESTLTKNTQQDAVLSVAVTNPSHGADALEIVLPANTQAFIDTPIYARTNGYLKHWYADIGARVHKGEVLAEIETPELDQQLQQVESDLATAQANQKIAQITAERWQKLLAKNAVSKQEADQAQSDFQRSAIGTVFRRSKRSPGEAVAGFREDLCSLRWGDHGQECRRGIADSGGRQFGC